MRTSNADSRQSTAPINMKLTRVTPAGLEVFGEVPTAFEFLVSEPPSQKTQMATLNYILRFN